MTKNAPSVGIARWFALAALVAFAVATPACGTKSVVADKPAEIRVELVAGSTPSSPTERLPISFVQADGKPFVLDLTMVNLDGSVRTSFNNWVRLSVQPGEIIETSGPPGQVRGPNVLLQGGVAKGIKVRLSATYGNTRVIAQDVGYVPAGATGGSQCSDGKDNDGNGYADYPVDPNCLFLTDDSEGPFTNAYGTTPPIYYAFPRIHDVQGRGTTPFSGHQVELPGVDPIHMYVSHITKDGMFIDDSEGDLPAHDPAFNAIFIYNINPPPEIHICDRITRLNGNVSIFGGSIQIGTAAWSKDPWLNPAVSGDCPLPDFVEVTSSVSSVVQTMQGLQGRLVRVKDPVIGTHFGKTLAPAGIPTDGASNCDLNGDGIAGCIASKGGFRDDENACCAACNADADCTEYNDFLGRGHVKIRFGSGGALYAQFSQIANFDPRNYLGPGKFSELRGSITTFTLPAPLPSFTVQARCVDDVILTGAPPESVRDVAHACVCYRAAPDTECTY